MKGLNSGGTALRFKRLTSRYLRPHAFVIFPLHGWYEPPILPLLMIISTSEWVLTDLLCFILRWPNVRDPRFGEQVPRG